MERLVMIRRIRRRVNRNPLPPNCRRRVLWSSLDHLGRLCDLINDQDVINGNDTNRKTFCVKDISTMRSKGLRCHFCNNKTRRKSNWVRKRGDFAKLQSIQAATP